MSVDNPLGCFQAVPVASELLRNGSFPIVADSIARSAPAKGAFAKKKGQGKGRSNARNEVVSKLPGAVGGMEDLPDRWYLSAPNARGGY